MKITTLEKYKGYYKLAKEPRSLKTHNAESWAKISKLLSIKEKASFDELTSSVKGHLHYAEVSGNEHQFIIYCIKSGWLQKLGHKD